MLVVPVKMEQQPEGEMEELGFNLQLLEQLHITLVVVVVVVTIHHRALAVELGVLVAVGPQELLV